MRQISVTALLLPLAFAGNALAADTDNFRLEKSQNGYVRMDTRTGEMSICEEKWGELVCRVAADERTAIQDEIERLQAQLDSLDARLAQIATLENRVTQLENSPTARIERALPTEEDFNKTMSYMERFFRGFMGIVKDLEGENSKTRGSGRGQDLTAHRTSFAGQLISVRPRPAITLFSTSAGLQLEKDAGRLIIGISASRAM